MTTITTLLAESVRTRGGPETSKILDISTTTLANALRGSFKRLDDDDHLRAWAKERLQRGRANG